MDLESSKKLEMLIEKARKIFNEALKKVDELAQKEPDDPKKWEFVKCHINDVYYDYVERYDISSNLVNDINWYGYEAVCDWLSAISSAGPNHIVQEAIKDYNPEDWAEYSVDQINDDSMEFFRPLW